MQIDQKPKNNNPNDVQEELERLTRKKSRVSTCTEELEKSYSHLPIVEGDGSSASSETEDIYAQKDEAVLKLKGAIRTLKKGQPVLNNEISRCHRNLDIIRSDTEKLTFEDPQNQYMAAEEEQGKQLRSLIDRRKSINNVLRKAQLALEIAESKRFPGKTPQRKGLNPAGPSPSDPKDQVASPKKSSGESLLVGPRVGIPKSTLRDETGDILSIGPLL